MSLRWTMSRKRSSTNDKIKYADRNLDEFQMVNSLNSDFFFSFLFFLSFGVQQFAEAYRTKSPPDLANRLVETNLDNGEH
jgi:hypothetical protein